MAKTTLFKNNRTQAVRIPAGLAFPPDVNSVEIVAEGKARLITPSDAVWDAFFDGPRVSPDFMETRDQPADQERAGF